MAQDIRNWLSPPDPWKNQNEISKLRHPGTAMWFVNGETFSNWKRSEQSHLLWIHGKRALWPTRTTLLLRLTDFGSGRRKERLVVCSLLYIIFCSRELIVSASSAIIGDIDNMRKSRPAILTFFYCDFKEEQKRDLRGPIPYPYRTRGDREMTSKTI